MSSDSSPGTPFPMDSPIPAMHSLSSSSASSPSTSTPSLNPSNDVRTSTSDSSSTLTFLLTFLAIFLVLMGMLLGGRRAYARRRAESDESRANDARREGRDKRPVMWDVWLNRGDEEGNGPCESSSAREDSRWADIMPLSAWVDPPSPRPRPVRSPPPGLRLPSPAPIPYAADQHVMMSQAWFRGIYPLETPDRASPMRPPSPLPAPELPKLHVSVLIQMPSPSRSRSQFAGDTHGEPTLEGIDGKSRRDDAFGRDAEYMIGLADMPVSVVGGDVGGNEEERGVGSSHNVRSANIRHPTPTDWFGMYAG